MSKARILGKWALLSAWAMVSGATRLAGHEVASTYHSRVAGNLAEAIAKHEIVFTGKLIKDSVLPMPSKAVYPYYDITRRLTFDVDTVFGAPDFKSKPYQVIGRDYLEIRTHSYLKPMGGDSLCQESSVTVR